VSGFKYVRIYLDDQTEKLYSEAVMTTGAAGKNQVNAFTRSLVKDVENPDLKKSPKFAEATYFDTILNPGDAMFIPRGAWHYVRSLSTSISVNFWF
jgi:lysine-specific demethylase 8